MKKATLALVMAGSVLTACSDTGARLVQNSQIVGDTIPARLTNSPGNAAVGEMLFADRDGGHCVLCHVVSSLDAPFQGNVGPDLSTVANRLTEAQIRLRIVDYQRVRPGTVMPSYYRLHDLHQVAEDHQGEPVLTAPQVEDLVAYLGSLKETDHDQN